MTERLFYVAAAPFEAARRLATLPERHRADRLHGHGFLARVRVALPPAWAAFPGDATERLTAALKDCVGALDYCDLNERLPVPSDENLARWVRDRLDVPGIASVGIRSAPDQGVDLAVGEPADRAHVWRRFRFESAHFLPHVPVGHPCGRLHGHSFAVILHAVLTPAQPEPDRDCDRLDVPRLDTCWSPLQAELDRVCLNDLPGLENPTSELLAHWLWQRLKPALSALSWISVYETATAGCHYDGTDYRIWKEQRFESALALPGAPVGDARRRLHGHSYLLRLHLTAPLDTVLGWTVDYGDIKRLFAPIYRRLDHQRLDALPGLATADPGSLARWIRAGIAPVLPQLDRIDLHETPGCGAALCWGQRDPALPA